VCWREWHEEFFLGKLWLLAEVIVINFKEANYIYRSMGFDRKIGNCLSMWECFVIVVTRIKFLNDGRF
jgi:hypothetical protein